MKSITKESYLVSEEPIHSVADKEIRLKLFNQSSGLTLLVLEWHEPDTTLLFSS